MLKYNDYDKLIKPIVDLYSEIEIELLKEIGKRFETYDSISGSLEWYLKKLEELGGLDKFAVELFSEYANKTQKEMYEMLKEAGFKSIDKERLINLYNKDVINTNPINLYDSNIISNVIDNSFKDTEKIFKMINTKAIESVKKEYIKVLNTAYLEVSSGIYDYNTSIKKALQNMAENGVKEVTYESGRTYSLESAVRRDILTALNQTACKVQEKVAEEIKAEYYYVSEHLGARSDGEGYKNHASWQGKVYKINGFDKKYDNFYTVTGYGKIEGLGGVNCRHIFYFFFPDIEEVPQKLVSKEENDRIYELSKRQRLLERRIRTDKKKIEVAKTIGDEEGYKKATSNLKKHHNELSDFIDNNKELRRQYAREKTQEQKINLKEFIVGKVNINDYDLTTKDVVILPNQIEHILKKEDRAYVYTRYKNEFNNILENSDYIIKDNKNTDTVFFIKNYPEYERYIQLVIKLNTNKESSYKNSIITMWEIKEKRLQNYIRKNIVLFDKNIKK